MSSAGGCRPAARPLARGGVTLIELVVTLALVALLAALAAPVLGPVARPGEAEIEVAVSRTRSAAVRRGETLTLLIERDGRWTAVPAASPDSAPVLSAALSEPTGTALGMYVSPLGSCIPQPSATASVTWDPIRCRPATEPVRR